MKNKIVRTFLTAILVHILLAITLYYTLGWADELPDELTARPTLVLLGILTQFTGQHMRVS